MLHQWAQGKSLKTPGQPPLIAMDFYTDVADHILEQYGVDAPTIDQFNTLLQTARKKTLLRRANLSNQPSLVVPNLPLTAKQLETCRHFVRQHMEVVVSERQALPRWPPGYHCGCTKFCHETCTTVMTLR